MPLPKGFYEFESNADQRNLLQRGALLDPRAAGRFEHVEQRPLQVFLVDLEGVSLELFVSQELLKVSRVAGVGQRAEGVGRLLGLAHVVQGVDEALPS